METELTKATGKTVSLVVESQWVSGKIDRVVNGLVYLTATYGDLIIRAGRVSLLSVSNDGKPT